MANPEAFLPVNHAVVDPRTGMMTRAWIMALQQVFVQAGAAGTGTVTTGGALTAGQLVVGAGGEAIAVGNLSGPITTSGSTATTITDAAVTYAKIQDVSAASRLLGRGSAAGAGDVQEVSLGTGLSMSGTTLNASAGGDVFGPSSATDNAIARYDSTTGKLLQNSTPLVEDDGRISTLTNPTNAQDAATKAYVDGQVGGAGALHLLAELTASSSASLDFASRNFGSWTGDLFQSDFDEYEIYLQNLIPVTNTVDLQSRVTVNSGSSWDSGANYTYVVSVFYDTGSTIGAAVAATAWPVRGVGDVNNTASRGGVCGFWRIFNPLSATAEKRAHGESTYFSSGVSRFAKASNVYSYTQSASPVNGIQFFFSSGNIASGTIRVYGVQS